MRRTLVASFNIAVAGLLVGPVVGWLCAGIEAGDGGGAATALVSTSPAIGLVRTIAAILAAGAMGAVAARFAGPANGMFCAGLALAWGAWSSAQLDAIVRWASLPGALWTLAIEGAILGVVGIGIGILAAREAPPEDGERRRFRIGPTEVQAFLLATVAGAGAAWVVARSEMHGQVFAAAAAAGLVAALVGRLVEQRAPLALFVGCGGVLAAVGPASAAVMDGANVEAAIFSHTVFALARPMPLHWISGVLVGIPVGAAWAASMTERQRAAEQG